MRRTIEIDVEITAEELAETFCEMTATEQAVFFNTVAMLSNQWEFPFAYQLQAITDQEILSLKGRSIMWQIGEYSEKV